MAIRISPEAEAELDDIWYYLATGSSSIEVAERMLDTIHDQLALLSKHPLLGRSRDDLRPGVRSITVGAYVVLYRVEQEDVVILHVLQGGATFVRFSSSGPNQNNQQSKLINQQFLLYPSLPPWFN